MKTDLFQSCGHCWAFQICWHVECSPFTASSFRIWNSSTGIPSAPLALFVVMLKILQARLQQYVNCELPDVWLVLEKAEEPEIKLPTSAGSSKKQESSRKTSISALLTIPKPLTVWITVDCGKFWKRRDYQTTWPASWEICMQVRKQQLELDMEQQTGSK